MASANISFHDDSPVSVTISFSGSLTEDSELPPVDTFKGKKSITLDLLNLKTINSTGIRLFMGWIHEIPVEEILAKNCPSVFVHQINTILNFLPPQTRINSFFVPYYDPHNEAEKQVLYKRGTDYERLEAGGFKLTHPTLPSSEGQQLELDVNPERYFNFLNRYA